MTDSNYNGFRLDIELAAVNRNRSAASRSVSLAEFHSYALNLRCPTVLRTMYFNRIAKQAELYAFLLCVMYFFSPCRHFLLAATINNRKILDVDDDTNICELLRLYLTKEGYQVTTANDGEEGLEKFNQLKPDMVLLDVMMPRMDGLEVCRRIRKLGNTPVMMLTAKGETFDKVLGLELGADDYMVKPFDTKEVVARIKAVLRRCTVTTSQTESSEGVIEFDNLRLDMNSYELRVKGKVVEAPPKELELLNCLASHPNRVYTRDQLLDEVWGFEYYGDSRTIDVHVKRLREKLAGASDKWELKTVWGVGYKFEVRQ